MEYVEKTIKLPKQIWDFIELVNGKPEDHIAFIVTERVKADLDNNGTFCEELRDRFNLNEAFALLNA